MKKPEVTNKRVAAIARKMLRILDRYFEAYPDITDDSTAIVDGWNRKLILTVAELKALAASALTQAPDRKKAKK